MTSEGPLKSGSEDKGVNVDESLYSRQLYVLGREAMQQMAAADVLLSGLGGLGVEVAKNLILGGVKSITVQDTKGTEWRDLSSQFYLSERDVGGNRAEVSLPHLSQLNPYVKVKVDTRPLSTQLIAEHKVFVLTEYETMDQLLLLSDFCHNNKIHFVLAQAHGVFGRIFCDFGKDFVILDPNGKPPVSAFVAHISKAQRALVTCTERHGLCDGDLVVFKEVEGMSEMNGQAAVQVAVGDCPFSFHVEVDTRGLKDYVGGGIVTQVKARKEVTFKSLRESEGSPKLMTYSHAKYNHPTTLHAAYRALAVFTEKHGRCPRPWNEEDATEFLGVAQQQSLNLPLDTELLRNFSFVANGNLAPFNAVVGGVAAQEVMKACSGKFSPVNQWLYLDAVEVLPATPPLDTQPHNNRYDGQTAVFGQHFQRRLAQQRWFIVGSGAIGCELLKNFALLGVGHLIVTDMDSIERSNLNRQFLFRPKDIGHNKAVTAKAAIEAMNPGIRVDAHENRVGQETEGIYNDDFFGGLDGVANALDNAEARLYMDRRCIFYEKPLLESGTLGTKGNTQVVIPFGSESYGSQQESPKDEIPLCTLKTFPNAIQHTLQWARDLFEGLFKQPMVNALSFLKDPTFLDSAVDSCNAQSFDTVTSLYEALVKDRPVCFQDCVAWARCLWERLFRNDIQQLLFNFPPQAVTSSGTPFWQSPKRCPHPLQPNHPLALDFVFAAANLRADAYCIPRQSRESVKEMLEEVAVPEFTPQTGVTIATSDDHATETHVTLDVPWMNQMACLLRDKDHTGIQLRALDFEKDDDANLHVDFVVASSNSRAANYGIQAADRLQSKLIAGKIIPAIATTTSVVARFTAIELLKVVQGQKDLRKYSNVFANLAIPNFFFTQPSPCPSTRFNDVSWTLWEKFQVEGKPTVRELIEVFAGKHRLEVTLLSGKQGTEILYASFMAPEDVEERLGMTIVQAVELVSGKSVDPEVRSLALELCCNDRKGLDIMVPIPLRYILPTNSGGSNQTHPRIFWK